MEVDLASVGPGKIEQIEWMWGQSSLVARGARTAETLTMLLRWNRDRSADCFGEAHSDLRFDPNTMRAQTLRLDLGKLVADSADLLDPSSIEETQTDLGHCGPSCEAHERMEGRHRETRRSIRMPSVIGP